MKTLKKKSIISLILTLIMIFNIVPFGAFTSVVSAAVPDTPTNFRLDNTVLRWDAVSGASEYTIGIYDKWSQPVETYTTSNTWWNLAQNALMSDTYTFRLTAKNADGNSSPATIERFYLESGKTEVNSISATITEPIAGEEPATTVTSSEPSKYSATVSQTAGQYNWYKGTVSAGTKMTTGQKFETGETYIVEIEFSPEGNNVFNVTGANVTLNGKTGSASGQSGYKRSFRFSFTISDATAQFAAKMDDIDLGTANDSSYNQSSYKSDIMITNIGTDSLFRPEDYMKLELTSGDVSAFNIDRTGRTSGIILKNSTAPVGSIQPVSNLSAGIYTATITLSYSKTGTGNNWEVLDTATVTFKVNGSGGTQHTISFDANGGKPYSGTIPINHGATFVISTSYSTLITPPENKEFSHWTINGTVYNSGDTYGSVMSSITLVAQWKNVTQYKVEFFDGGTKLTELTQLVNVGGKATEPTAPIKSGFKFDKWYEDGTFNTPFDFENTTISGDTIIYAKYDDDLYTITWQANGGNPGSNWENNTKVAAGHTETNVGDYLDPSSATGMDIEADTGKEYIGVRITDSNGSTDYLKGESNTYTFNENVTITYLWKDIEYMMAVNSYDTTLNKLWSGGEVSVKTKQGGGDLVESGYAYYATLGSEVEINAVAKPGYEFVEWRNGSETGESFTTNANYKFNAPNTYLTLYAIFRVKPQYTVTFINGTDSTTIDTVQVEGGQKVTRPTTDPTMTNHTFDNWYADSTMLAPFDFNTQITTHTPIYAKFIPNSVTPTYTILEGANQTYTIFSGKDIVIKASGDKANLTSITMDGTAIDAEKYNTVNGSTILTLKSSYLDTVAPGGHKIGFVYGDGSVETGLTIAVANSGEANDNGDNNLPGSTNTANNTNNATTSKTPKTGDSITLWIALLVVATLGTVGTVKYLRKRN